MEKTSFAAGCMDVPCLSDTGFDEAVRIARKADIVVVVAGLDLSQETEDHDRVSLLLPGKQMALISSVASAIQKPLVLVLTGGGPLDVSFAEQDPRIASILWIGYPGEAGAKALAEIIFGDFNPGWYKKFLNFVYFSLFLRAFEGHLSPRTDIGVSIRNNNQGEMIHPLEIQK